MRAPTLLALLAFAATACATAAHETRPPARTPFVPQNDLESALVAAATNPEARPRFYEALRRSVLFIIDEDAGNRPEGHHTLKAGTTLKIAQVVFDGIPHTPVFTSPARITAFENRQVRFTAMRAPELFQIVGGAPVILNPGSDYGKQLLPEEMAPIKN